MIWKQGFDEFCATLGDLSYLDLIRAVEQADAEAARAIAGRRRGAPAARAAGAQAFMGRAGRLLFWLRFKTLPGGHTPADLNIYRVLAVRLVDQGELRPEVLVQFGVVP